MHKDSAGPLFAQAQNLPHVAALCWGDFWHMLPLDLTYRSMSPLCISSWPDVKTNLMEYVINSYIISKAGVGAQSLK